MPVPGCLDDLLDIGIARFPVQHLPGKTGIGDEDRWISGPTFSLHNRDLAASHPPARLHDLSHAVPTSGSQVQVQSLAFLQPVEGSQVGLGQVIDMDIVPHAGAIGCRVITPENRDLVPLSQCDLEHDRDQVCFGIMVLAQVALRMCPGGIEISKRGVGKALVGSIIGQQLLDHQLGVSIGIDRLLRFLFSDRDRFRFAIRGGGAGKDKTCDTRPPHRFE